MSLFAGQRRWLLVALFAALTVFVLYSNTGFGSWIVPQTSRNEPPDTSKTLPTPSKESIVPPESSSAKATSTSFWSGLSRHHPVLSPVSLPSGKPIKHFKIQHDFKKGYESAEARKVRETRRAAVKEEFQHAWSGYKSHAWLWDEVAPISGTARNTFGGLAATFVDALDSLWILGMHDEFDVAVKAVANLDFTKPEEAIINVFEYTIRYLGGLLGAYEISMRKYAILLDKAIEVGEMLYAAFDTPNHMPITRWEWRNSADGKKMEASENTLVAELASLSLEFTTLSRLSKDPKYFDVIQRIADRLQAAQNETKLPGMWPVLIDAKTPSFSGDNTFTLGAMSDSLYEYLPKQHLLMSGTTSQYLEMYEGTLDPIRKHLLFRPMTKTGDDILLSGHARVDDGGKVETESLAQHLGCFAGGMLALGARLLANEEDLLLGRKLTDGCIWAYNTTRAGVMPEVFHIAPCSTPCQYQEQQWLSAILDQLDDDKKDTRSTDERVKAKIDDNRLVPPYTSINDKRYILRPEAIESVFYLYRITGDSVFLDKAWDMFTAIRRISHTEIANAAVDDVTVSDPPKSDRMESFWMAETLKYFYLIFSEPTVISLDEYVFNTEAHPFKIWDT